MKSERMKKKTSKNIRVMRNYVYYSIIFLFIIIYICLYFIHLLYLKN